MEAYKDEKVEWTIAFDKRKAASQHVDDAGVTPPKRTKKPKTAESDSKGTAICKPHNDNRGCTKLQTACPTKRAHWCDVLKSDGKTVCGSTSHTRASCPLASH